MTLIPHPRLAKRQEKARKHYYFRRERWYQCSGEPREQWAADCTLAEAYSVEDAYLARIPEESEAARVLVRGYQCWFDAACAAYLYGEARGWVYPNGEDRKLYAGTWGIVVSVAHRERALVTAFRPHTFAEEEQRKTGRPSNRRQWERLGVRRAAELSSLAMDETSQ